MEIDQKIIEIMQFIKTVKEKSCIKYVEREIIIEYLEYLINDRQNRIHKN